MDIEEKIRQELIDLDCPFKDRVFTYWTELLVAEFYETFKTPKMKKRYEWLAKKYNTTAGAIERVLIRGKSKMITRITEKYGIKTKITNESVVLLFKLKIF